MITNVAILINSLTSGGAERVVVSIMEHMQKNSNLSVQLILLEDDRFYPLDNNIKTHSLSGLKKNKSPIYKFIEIFVLAFKLKRYIKANNIKLVQSHLFKSNYVNILSHILGSRHVNQIVSHSSMSRFTNNGISGVVNFILIKYLYRFSDSLIFLTNAMRVDYQKEIGHNTSSFVINNPYNINSIVEQSNSSINDSDFSQESKWLLSIGRLIPLKRNRDLIDAYIHILNQGYDIKLGFIGDGPEKQSLEDYVSHKGLSDKVVFLGIKANPFNYLAKSDVLVLSSETEGFPNVLIEALACGTPIVSTDCLSGPREILAPDTSFDSLHTSVVERAKYGVLVPVGNVECLTEAIILLLSDSQLRHTYSEKGKLYASTFDVGIIVRQYDEVIQSRLLGLVD